MSKIPSVGKTFARGLRLSNLSLRNTRCSQAAACTVYSRGFMYFLSKILVKLGTKVIQHLSSIGSLKRIMLMTHAHCVPNVNMKWVRTIGNGGIFERDSATTFC